MIFLERRFAFQLGRIVHGFFIGVGEFDLLVKKLVKTIEKMQKGGNLTKK